MTVRLGDLRAVVSTSLDDPALQTVLDREAGWLAGRIGPLYGGRTETFYPQNTRDPIYLSRSTSSAVMSDDSTLLTSDDFTLYGSYVRRRTGSWTGPVDVTYTPSDEDAVDRALIELVRLSTSVVDAAMQSESIGDYNYTRASATATTPSRVGLVRSLLPRRGPASLRLRSSLEDAPNWMGWS